MMVEDPPDAGNDDPSEFEYAAGAPRPYQGYLGLPDPVGGSVLWREL